MTITIAELIALIEHFIPINAKLDSLSKGIQTIMATEQQVADALRQIDTATTKIAGNVQAIADAETTQSTVIQTISTEVDALVAALQNAGVSQALIDQATALGTKADAAATASDAAAANAAALVPVLQAIASKGVSNPVPVQPPPPPPPPPPTT